MRIIVRIIIVAAMAVIPLAFAASSEACDKCGYYGCEHDVPKCSDGTTNHDWTTEDGESYYCTICGCYANSCQLYGHDWYEDDYTDPTCDSEGWINYQCYDCGAFYTETTPATGHDWSDVQWVVDPWNDFDYTEYAYGYYCEECLDFRYAIRTVKKGKTKRILPKKLTKKAKKIKVKYNKKKVSATKKGKVKGKKRGAIAEITWRIKYKRSKTWYYFTAQVKVK